MIVHRMYCIIYYISMGCFVVIEPKQNLYTLYSIIMGHDYMRTSFVAAIEHLWVFRCPFKYFILIFTFLCRNQKEYRHIHSNSFSPETSRISVFCKNRSFGLSESRGKFWPEVSVVDDGLNPWKNWCEKLQNLGESPNRWCVTYWSMPEIFRRKSRSFV
jgi:hypothetical protein